MILELFIPDSASLKEKRKEIRSIKDKLKSRFNVSVAEVEGQDLWQRSSLGVAVAGSDVNHIKSVLSDIENFLERCCPHLIFQIKSEIFEV